MTNVLITYGSKMGGTMGLAQMVGEALTEEGLEVDVMPTSAVKNLAGYDAVVVGGALYATRWHKDARRFVKRHAKDLRVREVFFFSSGPLDASAAEEEIPPTHQVHRLMDRVGAHEHATFGGRLPADAKGFPAGAMAKDHAGDWRDPDEVKKWAHHVADVIREASVQA